MAERFSQKDARRALDRLLALSSQPTKQSEFAAELLATTSHPEVVQAAFKALQAAPNPEMRETLLLRIQGVQERMDPGGTLRALGIQALAPIATSEERNAFLRWTRFYEGSLQDETRCGAIRSAGLVGLARIDAARAVFEAIRILGDVKHTSKFNGEPAVTAAAVLAGMGETSALYTYCYTAVSPQEDVLAEALRGLTPYPEEIVDDIIRTFSDRKLNEPGETGLVDLALSAPPRTATADYLSSVLAHPDRYDLYGYAATAIAAGRNPAWLAFLAERATKERDRSKLYMLRKALPLAAKDPAIAAALESVEERYAATRDQPAEYRPGYARVQEGDEEFDSED